MERVRTRLTRATRREQIIDAAVLVFKGRDPSEVTFEEVADAAGVSRALVYNYFGDRRGLVAAVFRRHTDRLHDAVTAGFDGTETFREAVAKVVRSTSLYAQRQPGRLPQRDRRRSVTPSRGDRGATRAAGRRVRRRARGAARRPVGARARRGRRTAVARSSGSLDGPRDRGRDRAHVGRHRGDRARRPAPLPGVGPRPDAGSAVLVAQRFS